MPEVEEICDHIILVNKGKKILDGTVHGVKQEFKENLFSIKLDKEPGLINSPAFEVLGTRNEAHIVRIKEGYKPNDVLQYFMQQQAGIVGFNELLPSLNDIFIKLVEGTPLARKFEKVTA
jgi:ABC-2 type transport system ATP-binding protein